MPYQECFPSKRGFCSPQVWASNNFTADNWFHVLGYRHIYFILKKIFVHTLKKTDIFGLLGI